MSGRVLVVGSLNCDFVMRVEKLPVRGETVRGSGFSTVAGGKGANQAVAAGRLGAEVAMIGCVGQDDLGGWLLSQLQESGVHTGGVQRLQVPSGSAMITVDTQGDNQIAIFAGANGGLTPALLEDQCRRFAGVNTCLLQLEVPLESVWRAAYMAREAGACVVLDPAPAMDLPDELLRLVDLLTPNQTEAETLTGIAVTDEAGAAAAGRALLARGVRRVAVKMGAAGAVYVDPEQEHVLPGITVDPVDTTAAGDAFNGGFAAARAAGRPLVEALAYANAVAALSVTRSGAQPSLPTAEEVRRFAARRPEIAVG